MSTEDLNPRVALWLRAVNLKHEDITRKDPSEVARVTINDQTLPWTIHYVTWSSRMYREWAASLGYTQRKDGFDAHEVAMLEGGHKLEDHVKWIEAKL